MHLTMGVDAGKRGQDDEWWSIAQIILPRYDTVAK